MCYPSDVSEQSGSPSSAKSELKKKIEELEQELLRLKKEELEEAGASVAPSGVPSDVLAGVYERLRPLADLLPHMLWIADPEGRTLYNNLRFYEYSGVDPQSDDGWSWVKVLHPDDLLVANDEGTRAARERRPFQLEVRCRSKDGSYRWHLLHAMPLPDPSQSEPHWFGTATEIEDQKRYLEEMHESQRRLRILADAIPHMVFTAGPQGELDFVNRRWHEYTGLSNEQILGNGWQLLIHPEDLKKYMDEWNHALATGDTLEQEFRLKRAVGLTTKKKEPYLWHLARIISMRGVDGEIIKWFGTWTEIENQKRTAGTD